MDVPSSYLELYPNITVKEDFISYKMFDAQSAVS
jgi:hypothetical protein